MRTSETNLAAPALLDTTSLDRWVQQSPVIPVITINRLEDAVPMARALVNGGLNMLEITLRTKYGLEAIAAIKQAIPEAVVGVGTVVAAAQVEQVLKAGAEFIVTPGSTEALLQALIASNTPFLPGVSSLSEILMGYEKGIRRFKFFPAEVSGGVKALQAFAGPLPDIRFCPTGGVRPENLQNYLATTNVMAVGGTWLTTDDLVREKNWAQIEQLARQAAHLCQNR
jgi:2-dehydro-3-deoxyphosphogluconate aldolase/(4S)-4-hydroxy-2-oxoglutarate aldolase